MKKILLIEDNADIRENMAEILALSSYEVFTAPDGKEGVAAAITHKPDIIICDIMMPVLDGYGVIHMLQKNADTRNIPFIFLTAKAERDEVRKGMSLGADDYITKPFTGTELLNAIESRLRKTELLKLELSKGVAGMQEIVSHVGNKDMVQLITDEGESYEYRRKQVIYQEGNRAVRLYYVQRGRVKTYKTNDDGKELVTGIFAQGDFFGYVPILEQTAYKETAEALEDSDIATIPRDSFEELIYTNPEALKKMVSLLASNVTRKEEQLLGLAYNSLRKKVANALILVYEKYNNTASQTPVSIDISRENLASVAGTAKESLIRTLSDFKEEQLIDIVKGEIIVLNEKRLRNLMN